MAYRDSPMHWFPNQLIVGFIAALAVTLTTQVSEVRARHSIEIDRQRESPSDRMFSDGGTIFKAGLNAFGTYQSMSLATNERGNFGFPIKLAQVSISNLSTDADQRVEGFEKALKKAFPMTPDMVRKYREIYEENERAIREIPEPVPLVDTEVVVLMPGAPPPSLRVAPGIVSVIGFFDAYGEPWAIRQHVVGNGDDYRIFDLGEGTNSLAISPAVRVGWTNLVVSLEDEPLPVVARVIVDREFAHYRHDIRVLRRQSFKLGKREKTLPKSQDPLQSALAGFGLPRDAKGVSVKGVSALAWLLDGNLYLRSPYPLVSPPWTETASTLDGTHAYRLPASPVLLFSIGGAIIRADVELP